jgi:hypothetical protein
MSTESAGNQLLSHLAHARALRSRARTDSQALAQRTALRTWQSARLGRTYPDLLAHLRYHDAAQFFLDDLYGPKDFSQRDDDTARIVPTLKKILPEAALFTIAQAVELDALSEALDAALLAQLPPLADDQVDAAAPSLTGVLPQDAHEKGVSSGLSQIKAGSISNQSYALAYRACANQPMRTRQIEIVQELGASLNRLTKIPMLSLTLKMMRGPAYAAGLGELHEFLARGFGAFKKMGDASEFLHTIVSRERALMECLFAGDHVVLADPSCLGT